MLIEAARRNNAAAEELLALLNAGGSSCEEMREMMRISEATTAVLKTAQTAAASLIAKMQRHGDGGVGVLAEAAGLSRRDARGQVATAEAIAKAPSVRDAVESGRVSQANARRLAEAVNKTSAEAVDSDAGLLAKATALRPEDFAKEARRWAADHQDDAGERDYQRLRAKRKLRIWNADDGTVQLHGVFDPVTGKRIESRIRAEAGRLYDADKKAVTNSRTYDQCMADTFDYLTTQAPTAPTGGRSTGTSRAARASGDCDPRMSVAGRPASVSVATGSGADGTGAEAAASARPANGTNADAGRAKRTGVGRPFANINVNVQVDDATGKLIAELPDGARLPEAVLEELTCNARLAGYVYDTTGTAIWQTKPTRTATEGQRQALLNRWGGCFHCGARPDMCQIHHIVPVSQGGVTKIDNMVPTCWECHQKIHHHRWQVRKRPDGQHSLQPPNHTNHGPAHAPEQPLLFTQDNSNRAVVADSAGKASQQFPLTTNGEPEDTGTSPPCNPGRVNREHEAGQERVPEHPRAGPSGPATARAALGPRRPPVGQPAHEPLT